MSRYFAFAGVFIFSLVFVGCSHSASEEMGGESDSQMKMTGKTEESQGAERGETQESLENTMTEWSEAIAKGGTLRCTYSPEEGAQGTMEVDGEVYKTEFDSPQGTLMSVFDGETFFTWSEDGSMAYSMTQECLESFSDNASSDMSVDYEYYESSQEAVDALPEIVCQEVSDVDVSVPDDVDFVDQCSVMEEQMEAFEELKQQFPEAPEGVEMMP